jgi:multiple sugar transport system substrate-binding protein
MEVTIRISGRTRRQVLEAALVGAATGPVAACGPGQAATGSAVPTATLSGTIEFWHGWDLRVNEMRALADRFESDHPGVQVNTVQSSSVGQQKVVAAVLAGTPPDLLDVDPSSYALFVPAKALADLTQLLARDKIDPKVFVEADLKTRTVNGQILALPTLSAATGMSLYWNKAHFRDVGLNPDQPPATWSEVEQIAPRLTLKQGDTVQRLGIESVLASGVSTGAGARFVGWLYNNSGALYAGDGRQVAFETKEAIETAAWLTQLVKRQGAGPLYDTNVGPRKAFFAGALSMNTEMDNFAGLVRGDALGKDLDWGITTLPVNDRNPQARLVIPDRGGGGYAVMRAGKNPEGAWALDKYLILTDAQCAFMTRLQKRVSPLQQCNSDPEARTAPELQVFTAHLRDAVAVPFNPADAAIVKILEMRAQDAVLGKLAPDVAIHQAAREAQVALDEAWKQWDEKAK